MRVLMVGLALLAAACSIETGKGGSHGGGYTVDIRAVENSAVYVVTAPDGRVASARSHDGASAILDPQALQQAIAAMPAPATNPRYDDHQVSIRAPGFSLQASGDGKDGDDGAETDHPGAVTTTPAPGQKPVAGATDNDVHGRGHVSMNIGGFSLDAEGNGDEGNGRAHIHLAGLSARDARHFITEADELSPQVQSQMLTALGLSQDE